MGYDLYICDIVYLSTNKKEDLGVQRGIKEAINNKLVADMIICIRNLKHGLGRLMENSIVEFSTTSSQISHTS
jgi:hypothetical protein